MVDLSQVKLTPRDREILDLLLEGCKNNEIGALLKISPRTVKAHLRTIFLRAGIKEGRKRVVLATSLVAMQRAEKQATA